MTAENEEHKNVVSSIWLKAAVAGGSWASVEIIVGSFLHNLRFPFAGGVLASFGVMLMVAFYQLWPVRGLIWRAGVVCALMKSISPSAIIMGPMIGILSEAILLDIFIRLTGRSLPAVMVAGGIAVSAAFAQKVFNILILYGMNLVSVYLNLFDFASRQIGFAHSNPWVLIIFLASIYFSLGMISGITGYLVGQRSKRISDESELPELSGNRNLFSEPAGRSYSLALLLVNLLAIPAGILLLNMAGLWLSMSVIAVYIIYCLWYYPVLFQRLKRPMVWVQLIIIIVLSGLFWENTHGQKGIFDMQGVYAGIEMSMRALLVISGFTAVSTELRNPVVKAFLFRKGLRQVYGSVSLAFQALPAMIEVAVKPGNVVRRPTRVVAAMLANAGKWEKLFEQENNR